jgi:hypothetical protein
MKTGYLIQSFKQSINKKQHDLEADDVSEDISNQVSLCAQSLIE